MLAQAYIAEETRMFSQIPNCITDECKKQQIISTLPLLLNKTHGMIITHLMNFGVHHARLFCSH